MRLLLRLRTLEVTRASLFEASSEIGAGISGSVPQIVPPTCGDCAPSPETTVSSISGKASGKYRKNHVIAGRNW